MSAEVNEIATVISCRPDVRCLLIKAEGRAFGYGGDIRAFAADLDAAPANVKRWTSDLHTAIVRLQRMDATIVDAVQMACARVARRRSLRVLIS